MASSVFLDEPIGCEEIREVPAIPGCASQGEPIDELMANLHEAIEGCLAVDAAEPRGGNKDCILEIAA